MDAIQTITRLIVLVLMAGITAIGAYGAVLIVVNPTRLDWQQRLLLILILLNAMFFWARVSGGETA